MEYFLLGMLTGLFLIGFRAYWRASSALSRSERAPQRQGLLDTIAALEAKVAQQRAELDSLIDDAPTFSIDDVRRLREEADKTRWLHRPLCRYEDEHNGPCSVAMSHLQREHFDSKDT